jgi:hypothetical protein
MPTSMLYGTCCCMLLPCTVARLCRHAPRMVTARQRTEYCAAVTRLALFRLASAPRGDFLRGSGGAWFTRSLSTRGCHASIAPLHAERTGVHRHFRHISDILVRPHWDTSNVPTTACRSSWRQQLWSGHRGQVPGAHRHGLRRAVGRVTYSTASSRKRPASASNSSARSTRSPTVLSLCI